MGKKILVTLAVLLVITAATPGFVFADDAGPWVFGTEGARLGADNQGRDGFFYMYTPEINTGGTYNPARFGYLVWASTSFWRFFGGASWSLPYAGPQLNERFYNPNHVNEHGQPDPIDGHWFGLFGDGGFFPDAFFNPVLRWDAPIDGVFAIDAQIYAGVNHQFFSYHTIQEAQDDPTIDGVTVTIQQGNSRLFSANSGVVNVNNNRVTVPALEVEMQAGESLFFITDQNGDPNWDIARWLISISHVGGLPMDEPIDEEIYEDDDYDEASNAPDEDEPEDDEDIDEPEDEPYEENDEDQPEDNDYENDEPEDIDTEEYEYDEEIEDESDDEYIETEQESDIVALDDDIPEATEEPDTNESSNTVLIIVLVSVAVLGIGGAVIFMAKRRKTKDKPI